MPDIEDETRMETEDPHLDPSSVATGNQPETEPAEPTVEQQLQEERDGRIRAEERARIAEARPTVLAPPASPAQPPMTSELISEEYRDGKITDEERIQALVQLETEKAIDRRNRQDAIARNHSLLRQYMQQYPDLNDPKSSRLQKVSAELRELASRGHDPEDVRTQVLAVERAIGVKSTPAADDREFHRRSIPVGGFGSGATNGGEGGGKRTEKRKGEAIWDRLTAEGKQFYREYHRNDMNEIYATLDFADESLLMRRGRFAH